MRWQTIVIGPRGRRVRGPDLRDRRRAVDAHARAPLVRAMARRAASAASTPRSRSGKTPAKRSRCSASGGRSSRRTATSSRTATSVEEIEAIRKSGRTAIVLRLPEHGAGRAQPRPLRRVPRPRRLHHAAHLQPAELHRLRLLGGERHRHLVALRPQGDRGDEPGRHPDRPLALRRAHHARRDRALGARRSRSPTPTRASTSARGVYGAGRQKTTEAIKALAARRGVIGLSPNRNMTKRGAATTLEEFGDMVAWVVDRIGVDAVGIGTDYCPGHTGLGAQLVALRALVARDGARRADDDGAARGLVGLGADARRAVATSSRSSRAAASRPTTSPRSWAATGCACSPRPSSPRLAG